MKLYSCTTNIPLVPEEAFQWLDVVYEKPVIHVFNNMWEQKAGFPPAK